MSFGRLARHLAAIAAIAALLALCIAYPFLPGDHDQLAVPISTMAQVFGVVGLVLVPGGVLWLIKPALGFALAVVSIVVGTCVALIVALFATLSVGKALGVLTLALSLAVLLRVIPGLSRLRRSEGREAHPAPWYLVALPLLALASQMALHAPLARVSRDRAIANAGPFIADIEAYHARHGQYPISLQAQHRDYHPDVVGIDEYVYMAQGDSYNLSFEQPRFVLDRFGTREWIVYNPRNQHRAYSHKPWRAAPPEVTDSTQGWYASGEIGHAYWKYFYFD